MFVKSIKIRLYPSKEQEILMLKSAGVARFSYNWGLDFLNEYYKENEKSLSINDLRKEFTKLRNTSEYPWLKDLGEAFKNINKSCKVRKLNKKLKRLQRKVSRKYDRLKSDKAFKKGEKLIKTKNIVKLERKIKLIHKKIADICLNYIHQTTNSIVKTKPYRIVVEDLNVKGMMKNKHLSKAIGEQCFNKFINILEYKCKWSGIKFIKADRFYPSSKMCSSCKAIKKDLKLSDRVYKCSCGLKLDRDKNVSINLANYKLA